MKKFTTILLLLLMMSMGAWAQPDTGKTFTLNCARGYVYYNGTQLAGISDENQASEFAIIPYEEQTYLYDVTQAKFVCHTTDAAAGTAGNPALESDNDFSKAVKGLKWGETNIENYPYYLQDSHGNWLNMDKTPLVYFNTWNDFEGGNGGNTYAVKIKNGEYNISDAVAKLDAYFNPSTTVKYVISDANGVVYTSEPVPATAGATISSLPSDFQRPYCTYSEINQTMVVGENTVNVTVTYNLPFTVSTDFENATWYYATIRDSKYLRADDANKDSNGRYTTNNTNEKTDAYKWAFFGNPYSYFYIANKGQGAGKYLKAGTVPIFETIDDPASTDATLWEATVNVDGFTLRSITGANLYINDAGGAGNLGYWDSVNGKTDGGSKWKVEAVPAAEVTVTYNVVIDGKTVVSASELQAVGGTPAVPASLNFDYTTYTYDVTEITATTTVVTATPTFNMPFMVSTDYDNATWYYLHGHATYNNYYISTNGDATQWNTTFARDDAHKWAFIGNPVEGIKVINKAAGNGKYLTASDDATTMTTTATAWVLKKQTSSYSYGSDISFGLWSSAKNNYANCAGGTVKYWSSFDQGSTFWVEEVPAITVNVTFNLLVDDEIVKTIVQEDVAGNTVISVPASLTANYSTLGYDFTGNEDVNVGETDLIVNVTATLKSGVLNNLDNVSNSKAYTLNTERGSLYIKNGHLASNYNDNAGATPGTFALINYEDNYYLYSVDASKFVLGDGTLSETVTSAIATLSMEYQTTLKPLHLMIFGGKGLNVTNTNDDYELVINNWITPDAGNRYCIVENAEFDATDALAALEEYFHPTAEVQFTKVIAQLEAYPYGTGLNQYRMVVEGNDYTSQATTIINGIKSAGYSEENLTNAQLMLDGTSINIPVTNKFYRIKGYSGNYITSNNTGSNASMNGTAGVSNIVYYSAGKNIIFYNGGYGLYNTSIVAPVGSTLNEYTFSEGAQIGHYYIRSNYTDGGQYCYDNTTNETKLDRNGSPVTSDSYQTDWTLEEVTELPITLNSAGDGYYATLYLPVDATITGADAYTIQVNDAKNAANTTQLDGGMVPANTAVLLKGTSGTATATVNTNDTFDSTTRSDLSGTLVAVNANGSTDYFLGKNTENQVGFYHWSGSVLKGFRAYLVGKVSGTSAKGFTLVFDEATGINTIENGKWTIENENVYNLQGQKVNRAQKGVYIVNGKKVVMK